MKWERIFGGILELPWSLRYDRRAKTAALRAFSYSKLLEKTSASGMARDLSLTGDCAAAATVTSISPDTSDLSVGDTIYLDDGTNQEGGVIDSVDSSSQVTLESALTNTYTGAEIILDTPYPRYKSISTLAGDLFELAGIDHYSITLSDQISSVLPFPQVWTPNGLASGNVNHLIDRVGSGVEVQQTGAGHIRSTAPDSDWGVANPAGVARGDWTPYLSSIPGSLVAVSSSIGADIHINKDGVSLSPFGQGFDHTGAYRYTLVPNFATNRMMLYRNGLSLLSPWWTVSGTGSGNYRGGIEFLPAADWGWTHDVIVGGSVGGVAENDLWVYRNGAATAVVNSGTPGTDLAGISFRCAKELEGVFMQDCTGVYPAWTPGVLSFWQPSDTSPYLHHRYSTASAQPRLKMHTLRVLGQHVVCLYNAFDDDEGGAHTHARIWDKDTLEVQADFKVSDSQAVRSYLTQHTLTFENQSLDILVGAVQRDVFMIAEIYAGVVVYADFSNKSVAGALRQLALLSMATAEVDRHGNGLLRPRGSAENSAAILELADPIARESSPVWEYYKTSAEVSGEDSDGAEVSVVAGDDGDSARRIDLQLDLPITSTIAEAIGELYVAFYSAVREQENVTVKETGTILRTFDRVKLDGVTYMVLEPEFDARTREQSLVLVTV